MEQVRGVTYTVGFPKVTWKMTIKAVSSYLCHMMHIVLVIGAYVYMHVCKLDADWAEKLTQMGRGKHHLGDFLPPEELEKFMETYDVS